MHGKRITVALMKRCINALSTMPVLNSVSNSKGPFPKSGGGSPEAFSGIAQDF
jgi:hypothetical protein